MCGIVGLYSQNSVARELYESLLYLQHRGQDAAGIVTAHQHFDVKRGLGTVKEVFQPNDLHALQGNLGLGHTRYATTNHYGITETQPIWNPALPDFALAHSGHIINAQALAQEISVDNPASWISGLDSEILLHLLANGLKQTNASIDEASFFKQIFQTIQSIAERVKGAYSVVAMIQGKGLIAFRDSFGRRPLSIGMRTQNCGKTDYLLASEDSMFPKLGFTSLGDVAPGEVIYINLKGEMYRRLFAKSNLSPCMFEYVYLAHKSARLDQISVLDARQRLGIRLAESWKEQYPHLRPDIVLGVPFTAQVFAESFATRLKIPYMTIPQELDMKRTFIMQDEQERLTFLQQKFTPKAHDIYGKKVLMIDDSIVRGVTSREVVKKVRELGAEEVYFASACPPLKHPCFYGIKISSSDELIASDVSSNKIAEIIGVDALLYQNEDDLKSAILSLDGHVNDLCMACINGCYKTDLTT